MRARKTLASRVFATLFITSVAVMLVAAIAAMAASFSSYEHEAEQLLLSQATAYGEGIAELDEDGMVEALSELPLVDIRCTLVAADGTVLFDSFADPSTMDNHARREEIAAAKDSGQFAVMRRSATLSTDTLYAAVLVRDGIVLRLAETRASLASFLRGMSTQLVVSLLAIFVVSLVLSRILTQTIARPLQDIDITRPLDNDAYEELQPLLARVDDQRRRLESQNVELERAVTMRREFAGNVSHEMKTPLQVIGGYAELMQAGLVSADDIPKFAGLICEESSSMRALIDDVLALSKLDEQGDAEKLPVSLPEVCRRVVQRLEPAAEERSTTVTLVTDGAGTVLAHEAICEQMVYNLVANAIEHGSVEGHVDVSVSSRGGETTLVVADDGPGIPEAARERVFERFYRVDASRSRQTGGTGLGLAIVKHAAESMGGSVRAEESHMGGASFVVTLPSAPTARP